MDDVLERVEGRVAVGVGVGTGGQQCGVICNNINLSVFSTI